MMCCQEHRFSVATVLLCAILCTAVAAEDRAKPEPVVEIDLYEVLGVPKTATTQEIKKAYRDLALKWHPDKIYGEGGAWDGVEASEVSEEDKEEAKATWYRISAADEILTDEKRRAAYDRSPHHSHAETDKFREKYGNRWGDGCHNFINGCMGSDNIAGQVESQRIQLGPQASPTACVMACTAHAQCVTWSFYHAAHPGPWKSQCFGWNDKMEWRPQTGAGLVSSGFAPNAAEKHRQRALNNTSLFATAYKAAGLAWSFIFWWTERVQDDASSLVTLIAGLVTIWLVVQYRESNRQKAIAQVEEDRRAYREAELQRIREEVEERKRQKELEKELKRESWEAKQLEEERKATEAQAKETLLRSRMQTKYNTLEEKKRAAREERAKEEEEARKRKEEEQLKKTLPSLYREVAKETGEYTDNIGNTTTATGNRLGGMSVQSDSQPRQSARRAAVSSAQERLDTAVSSGQVPDADTLVRQKQEADEEQRRIKAEKERERMKKAVPSLYNEAYAGNLAVGRNDEEVEDEAGPPLSASALDPRGQYAAGAAAAAAERRTAQASASGAMDEMQRRYEEEKHEREERERKERELAAKNKKEFVKRSVPQVIKEAEKDEARRVGTGAMAAGAKEEGGGGGDSGEVKVLFRDSKGGQEDLTLELETAMTMEEVLVGLRGALGLDPQRTVRLVFAGRVLKAHDTLKAVLSSSGVAVTAGLPPVILYVASSA